jgi:hypothetical protein
VSVFFLGVENIKSQHFSFCKIVAPSRLDILVAGFQDEEYVNDRYHFWNNVYGFKMSRMKRFVLQDGQVDYTTGSSVCTDPVTVKTIDTKSSSVPELDFDVPVELKMKKDGKLHGIVGWFDTYFQGPKEEEFDEVFFSTSPFDEPTHWKQTIFLFESPLDVTEGQIVKGRFITKKSPTCSRELVVRIQLENGQIDQTFNVR